MYRVELKAEFHRPSGFPLSWFLMYRVELKVPLPSHGQSFRLYVPNVPCGVESYTEIC